MLRIEHHDRDSFELARAESQLMRSPQVVQATPSNLLPDSSPPVPFKGLGLLFVHSAALPEVGARYLHRYRKGEGFDTGSKTIKSCGIAATCFKQAGQKGWLAGAGWPTCYISTRIHMAHSTAAYTYISHGNFLAEWSRLMRA